MYKKILSDFSQGTNLACAPLQLGLDSQKTPWAESFNVEIFNNKGICRQAGNRAITTTPEDAAITSIYAILPPDAPNKPKILYTTENGKFYEYDVFYNVHKLKKEDIAEGDRGCLYVSYLGGVVVSDGVSEPFFYDKSGEIKEMKTAGKDKKPIIADALTSFKSRLWLAMGDTVYFSGLGSYDLWFGSTEEEAGNPDGEGIRPTEFDAGYISNFHCDASPIRAMATYKDYIAIYKENQTYLLSGSSPDDFAVSPFADKGAAGANAIVSAANKQYFFSTSLFTLEQTGILAQIALGAEASLPIKPALRTLDKNRLKEICALAFEPKNQLWFFLPIANTENIGTIWIYDYVNNAWMQRKEPQAITCGANLGTEIITGTADGKILLENTGETFDGLPISFSWKSPFLTLGNVNARKYVDEMYFLISDEIDNNFHFSVFKDYDTTDSQDHEKIVVDSLQNMRWEGENNVFECAQFWDKNWSIPTETAQKVEVSGSCISVQFCISGERTDQNCAVLALEFKEITED